MAGRQQQSPPKWHRERERATPAKNGRMSGVSKRRSKLCRPALSDAGTSSHQSRGRSRKDHGKAALGATGSSFSDVMVQDGDRVLPLSEYLAVKNAQHAIILKRVSHLPPNDLLTQLEQSTPSHCAADQPRILFAIPVDEIEALEFVTLKESQNRTRVSCSLNLTRATDSQDGRPVSEANNSQNSTPANDSQNGTLESDSHHERPVCANCIGSPAKDIKIPQLFTFGVFTSGILLY